MTEIKKSFCPYDCPAACGLLVHTEGDQVLKVEGDPEHPVSRGLLCRKMRHYREAIQSPKRILTPLKRTGPKGSGEFAPISWEEAVTEITARWQELLQKEGPTAIGYCCYSGVMSILQRNCATAFFRRLGAPELVKTLCSTAKNVGYQVVAGTTCSLDPRELVDSDFYLVWGANMTATQLPALGILSRQRKQGKRAVLIEVFAEPMKAHCDETILIRPGTDGALALAMMHVLAKEGMADTSFLEEKGAGFEAFAATLPAYTPQWAQEVTGVPAPVIESLAREFGRAKAPAIILGSGNSRYTNGANTVRLVTLLSLFTGAWKRPGGGICGAGPVSGPRTDASFLTRPDWMQPDVPSININQLAAALTGPAPLKSLYVGGSNPANSVSDQKTLLEGLAREDLFTVVNERFMSDTARYADIILPATFSVEQADCFEPYGFPVFSVAQKAVMPPGETKSNWDTLRLLARSMGFEDPYFELTEEEMVAHLLDIMGEPAAKKTAVTALPLSDRIKLMAGGSISLPAADHTDFRTPDGRFYIVNPECPLPVPGYQGPFESPESLHLVSVPSDRTLNSIYQQHEGMVAERGPMCLYMHPEDAASRGIADGDRVCASNDLAQVHFFAKLTEQIARGAVAAVGVYNRDQSLNGLTCNALQHGRLSDMGAATTMNDNRVDVVKL